MLLDKKNSIVVVYVRSPLPPTQDAVCVPQNLELKPGFGGTSSPHSGGFTTDGPWCFGPPLIPKAPAREGEGTMDRCGADMQSDGGQGEEQSVGPYGFRTVGLSLQERAC